ncbi:MAG: transcription elongation factor GreA [Desulfobacteraceae bacterium]|nr:transcription elongation factor GreA [Desulfobacteraceae bacterium]
MEKIPITKEGLERLREELNRLVSVERPKNIRAIVEARGHGDISENTEFHAAKERQSFLAAKINEMKTVISQSEVIEVEEGPSDCVTFGRTVVLYNVNADEEVAYQLLGPYEADPGRGTISVKSPLGQALIGRQEGDEVKVKAPRGIQEFEILEIR